MDLEKDLEKYKSKLVVIIGDFFRPTNYKRRKYPQIIQAIKKVAVNSIILVSLRRDCQI